METDKLTKLTFEAALDRLEGLVDSMEQGEVPLAELLAKYEEGTKLLKVCELRLKDAELKIEKLKKQKDGSVKNYDLEILKRAKSVYDIAFVNISDVAEGSVEYRCIQENRQ